MLHQFAKILGLGPAFGLSLGLSLGLALAPALAAGDGTAAREPDPRVAWLRDHAVELATLDPAAEDFADLGPLEEALDGVRVVVLGEATRGDGGTLLAKARLVRFLHRKMGFDVLALECGFYACDRAWRESRPGESTKRALAHALPPVYAESDPFQPLLDLVAERRGTDRPLVVAGFEPELAGAGPEVVNGLREALRARGVAPEDVPGFEEVAEVVEHLTGQAYLAGEEPLPSKKARKRFAATLEELGRRLAASEPEAASPSSDEDTAFWRQVLENLDAEARMAWEMGVYRRGQGVSPKVTSLANRQAAENVLWLAQRDPGRRIVVSSLTVLLARDTGRLETGDREVKARLERFATVGDVLDDALGDEAYVVGFTAFQGRSGTPFREPYDLLEPTEGSFEELMARTGLEAAFVERRGLETAGRRGRWLTGPVIARPLSHLELRGSWPRHLDAFVFLRTLEPSRRASGPAPR